MLKLRIMILYPDPAGLALLTSMLKSLGHTIEEATNDRVAVRLMERNNIDLVLAGVDPLDNEALELLTYVRRKHREVPVILLFPRLHSERAKEALRLGAMAVLKYPVPAAELRAAVLQALELSEAKAPDASATSVATTGVGKPLTSSPTAATELAPAVSPRSVTHTPPIAAQVSPLSGGPVAPTALVGGTHRVEQLAREIGLIGNDPSWRQVIDLAATIAVARTSVLVLGEPGTG